MQYIMTPVYTRLLTPGEYGQVSVFLTWTQVLGIFAMFCLSSGVFNNGMLDYPDRRNEYSFSMLALSNLITLVFSTVLLGTYPWIKELIRLEFPLLVLMCALFLFQPAFNFFIAKGRYELKYKSAVTWTVVSVVISPVVAVCAIALFPEHRLYAQIFGSQLPLILIYAGFAVYLGKKSSFRVETVYWKAALLFNLPLIPHYLSVYLLNHSDRLMISWLVGNDATAFYSVAYSVASVANIVWGAVNSSLIPYTYEKCKKNDYKAISAVTLPILTVIAAVCILVIMMAPEVVAVMATSDYKEAIYVIPPVVGGVFFQMHYFIYANIVYYYKKPKYVMYGSVFSTILNIGLNYVFILKYGYIAAGYTTLACYLLQAAIDYFAMKKVVDVKVYNMRFIGFLSAVMIFIALLSSFIYDYALIRYGIVVSLIIITVVFRQKLIEMFTLIG